MDIKAEIEKIVAKVTKDDSLKEKFTKDPEGTVRGLVGDKADNDTVKKIIDGIKKALGSGAIGKITDKIGGLFGKKNDDKE
ncbi:MAG: hypothetical protein IKI58_07355 [Oscillospiraceae bacterium]|nr:hypothetical protein [Oscillospiraceae bacterium]